MTELEARVKEITIISDRGNYGQIIFGYTFMYISCFYRVDSHAAQGVCQGNHVSCLVLDIQSITEPGSF